MAKDGEVVKEERGRQRKMRTAKSAKESEVGKGGQGWLRRAMLAKEMRLAKESEVDKGK